jgi:hypothetical protein
MNSVLLTGAGFTKPFGGYLASEMWATIFNQPEVQKSPTLLKGMRDEDNLDYETFYDRIQTTGTEREKTALSDAIRSAFLEMDDNIRTHKAFTLSRKCCEFISRIVQDQSPNFIFTLNQDMFFERFHSRDLITVVPGLPDHFKRFADADRDQSAFNFRLQLPTVGELGPRKAELYNKGFAQIAYVKLHGSQGWVSHDKSDVLVIGTQKASIIENEPLLTWYLSLFEEVINRPETRLLTVGYGFGDKHINERIAAAMGRGLRLYVISPQLPQDFKNQFKAPLHGTFAQKPSGDELWEGLVQYWPATLTDFYYDNMSPPNNLKHRGRALFRSLGLA